MSVEFMDAASTADVPDPDGSVHAAREESECVKLHAYDSIQMTLLTKNN